MILIAHDLVVHGVSTGIGSGGDGLAILAIAQLVNQLATGCLTLIDQCLSITGIGQLVSSRCSHAGLCLGNCYSYLNAGHHIVVVGIVGGVSYIEGVLTCVAHSTGALPSKAVGQSDLGQALAVDSGQAGGNLIAGVSLGNGNGVGCREAVVIINDGNHRITCIQIQNSICPILSNLYCLTVDGDSHIADRIIHTLNGSKQITQGHGSTINQILHSHGAELILCQDVLHLPGVHICSKLVIQSFHSRNLGFGINGTVSAQSTVDSLHSLLQGSLVLSAFHGQLCTVYIEPNHGLAANVRRNTDGIERFVILAEDILQAKGQGLLLNGTGFHAENRIIIIEPHGIAVTGNHGVDHIISIVLGLVTQRHRTGNQADMGNARIKTVGRINALLLNHQVGLIILLNQLLHSAIDGTAEAAALAGIVCIICAIHQLQGCTRSHGGIDNIITVQIQHHIFVDGHAIHILGQNLNICGFFTCRNTDSK